MDESCPQESFLKLKKSVPLPGSPDRVYTSLDEWILHEVIPFSVDSPETFNASIDKLIASFGDSVELPGLGEALHGGEDILILRGCRRPKGRPRSGSETKKMG